MTQAGIEGPPVGLQQGKGGKEEASQGLGTDRCWGEARALPMVTA